MRAEQDAAAAVVDAYLDAELAAQAFAAVHRDPGLGGPTWYVRLAGEAKEWTTIWFALGDVTLSFEHYFMPPPEENVAHTYRLLLAANHRMRGAAFTVGPEGDVYLRGHLDREAVTAESVDRAVGIVWEAVERWFRAALRSGFASRVPA